MVFSVYLVDDEPLAIQQLKSQIPWDQFGMQIVGSSTDPIFALEEIAEIRPHAVFTDMKMPGMNGDALARSIRQIVPGSEVVIISAWSEFEYVRSALREGVFDYLLKPLKPQEYTPLLQRLYQKLVASGPDLTAPGKGGSVMRDIQNYIRANLKEKLTLSDLADRFHLSQNAVCSYFNRYLGTTFVAYLTDLRMKRAKKLLTETDLSIKEIASQCGYDDYFYFCRVFQRTYRCTPTQLRTGEKKGDSQ